jgi:hypothetical protein
MMGRPAFAKLRRGRRGQGIEGRSCATSRDSVAHMSQAVGLEIKRGRRLPRASPWAGMKQAVGLMKGTRDSCSP